MPNKSTKKSAKKSASIQLPPDPEGMNDERAEWAEEALEAFKATCGTEDGFELRDLLCNLHHWADRNGVDFNRELWASDRSYREETMG